MVAKKVTALSGDFVHVESGVFVEVDASQHFTSFRLATLDLYPDGTQLGFDLTEYKSLCRVGAEVGPLSARQDRRRFRPSGPTKAAWYSEAVGDLVTPAVAHPAGHPCCCAGSGRVRGVRESPRPPANTCDRPETRAVWSGPVPAGRIQPQPNTVTAAALPTLRRATTEEGSASGGIKTDAGIASTLTQNRDRASASCAIVVITATAREDSM